MAKRTSVFIITLALAIGAPILVGAADYLPKNKDEGGNVTVAGDKEYKNLFVGGANVSINRNILGDLFAAGASINLGSPVEKDLFAAGSNIIITAPVGDDARVAGGNVVISAPVAGDLMVAGGTVNVSQAATVGGDFWAGAGALNLNSNVKGNVKIAGGEILINSEIGGDVEIQVDEKLVFGPQSKILGKVSYWGAKEAVIQDGAEVGQIEFHKRESAKAAAKFNLGRIFGVFLFVKMAALFIVALIALKLFGKTAHSIVSRSYAITWASLGVGFLGLIAIPVAVIILLATVVGFLAGLILLFWFIMALIVSSIFATLFVGSLVERWLLKHTETKLTWKTAIWGVVVGAIITLIPVVGGLAMFAIYLITFGSLLQEVKSRLEI